VAPVNQRIEPPVQRADSRAKRGARFRADAIVEGLMLEAQRLGQALIVE
jgi:hypothetical protein